MNAKQNKWCASGVTSSQCSERRGRHGLDMRLRMRTRRGRALVMTRSDEEREVEAGREQVGMWRARTACRNRMIGRT